MGNVITTDVIREPIENFELLPIEAPARKRATSQPREGRAPVQRQQREEARTPVQRQPREEARTPVQRQPRGDGYLKILQKLQARAPATGGLRSKLLDGAGTAS